ncbi:hypothetical protein Desal_0376 [Maridesulfovibrio salexigens DSM 2638]|uniref:Uncharacterized protein n=1 Tax=Maridesulfovibrio salexigens (strain ATCC 14822 / DSM 2638 / NCIMB 8403 / VKM B-1763) TaxID=526222 RepID=C6BWW3_MARSD|nr:hypothetical protein Desal_0376 [Maridesulfovibrio salexigens DSM 2638]
METHLPEKQTVELKIIPDMNFAFSGNAEERSYLGLDKGKSDLNLSSLDAKYFLLLLVEEGHAENAQAVLSVDAARRELECCTPDMLFITVGFGMNRREAIRFHKINNAGIPMLADPVEHSGALREGEQLPVVFMLKKEEDAFAVMFVCNDLVSGPAPLVIRINDALSGKPGRKCIRRK